MENIDINKFLSNIHGLENPNDEELPLLKKYYEILFEMYDGIHFENHIEKAINMWLQFDVDTILVDKIRNQARAFADDESIMRRVKLIYERQILEIDRYWL